MKHFIYALSLIILTGVATPGLAQAAPALMMQQMCLHRPMMCRGGFPMRPRFGHPPVLTLVFRDLHAIQRLALFTRNPTALEAVYQHVLVVSHNPFVRNYVALRLARLELARPKGSRSLALLEHTLDQNLTSLNHAMKMHRGAPPRY